MTIEDLQAKRDAVLQQIEVMRIQKADGSVEFANKQQTLAIIDSEIAKLTQSGTPKSRCSLATFSKD